MSHPQSIEGDKLGEIHERNAADDCGRGYGVFTGGTAIVFHGAHQKRIDYASTSGAERAQTFPWRFKPLCFGVKLIVILGDDLTITCSIRAILGRCAHGRGKRIEQAHGPVEGDKRLFNQYGDTLVNPAKHLHVKADLGQQFIDWLVSPEGQGAIAGFKIGSQQLFYPNANDPSA